MLGQAAVATVIAATVWAAGSLVTGRGTTWRARPDDAPMQDAPMPWALTMALGFAVVGQLLTLAGLIGMLRKPVVLAITIAIHVAAIPAWRRLINANAWTWWRRRAGAAPASLRAAIRAVAVVVAVTLLTAFFLTLYPPLGFDQTMYHLPFARAFAATGELPFLPALRYPMFPPLAEVLNAAVLMFAGDIATQATGWVALVACAGLAYAWATDLASAGLSRRGHAASRSGPRPVSEEPAGDVPADSSRGSESPTVATGGLSDDDSRPSPHPNASISRHGEAAWPSGRRPVSEEPTGDGPADSSGVSESPTVATGGLGDDDDRPSSGANAGISRRSQTAWPSRRTSVSEEPAGDAPADSSRASELPTTATAGVSDDDNRPSSRANAGITQGRETAWPSGRRPVSEEPAGDAPADSSRGSESPTAATGGVGDDAVRPSSGTGDSLAAASGHVIGDDERHSSRLSGSLAAAIIVGSPIALYLAAAGYVEPLLALLGGAALFAADVAARNRTRTGAAVRWLVAAGVLAGSAASVKYLGLYFVPAAALLIFAGRFSTTRPGRLAAPMDSYVAPVAVAAGIDAGQAAEHQGQRGLVRDDDHLCEPLMRAHGRVAGKAILRDLAIYFAVAIAALLPCYGRLVAHTGNPVFPFSPELFGANHWGLQVVMGPSGAERWSLTLTRLWDVTFRRDAVGGLPHYSPAFVFALPVIVVAVWCRDLHRRRLLLLLSIAIGYLLVAPPHAHYLFTIAVLWSALAGAAAASLLRARPGVLIAVALLLACGGEAYALHRLYRLGPPPVTSDDRERLIAAQRPLYPAIAWLNRTAGPVTLYAINAEVMVDYASGTLLGDYNGPASFDRMEARVRATGSVAAALDAIGASHLLVPAGESFWNAEASRDPRLTRIYDDGRAAIYRVAAATHERRR